MCWFESAGTNTRASMNLCLQELSGHDFLSRRHWQELSSRLCLQGIVLLVESVRYEDPVENIWNQESHSEAGPQFQLTM